jgi:hypothetical protein
MKRNPPPCTAYFPSLADLAIEMPKTRWTPATIWSVCNYFDPHGYRCTHRASWLHRVNMAPYCEAHAIELEIAYLADHAL